MNIDPLNIFMAMLRIAPVIIAVVLILIFLNLANVEIKSDDLERTSLEITENLFASEKLMAGKYIFDPHKLDLFEQSSLPRTLELPFLRSCSYGYFIHVEDLQSGKVWKFGYKPNDIIYEHTERTFLAGIQNEDPSRPSNYYGSVKQGKVAIELYGTWLTRSTCLVEKAFALKERQEMKIPCLLIYDRVSPCGFSLKREGSFACTNTRKDPERWDCRYLPPEINFETIDVAFEQPLREHPSELKKKIVAYPIKEGIAVPQCGNILQDSITGKNDNVQTVLLCAEDAK